MWSKSKFSWHLETSRKLQMYPDNVITEGNDGIFSVWPLLIPPIPITINYMALHITRSCDLLEVSMFCDVLACSKKSQLTVVFCPNSAI